MNLYSYFDATDRIWGVYAPDVDTAARYPDFEFASQAKSWCGLVYESEEAIA